MDNIKIIVALDYDKTGDLYNIVDALDPSMCKLKIGYESFTVGGRALVEKAVNDGFDVLLDLKLHDIPQTIYRAVKAIGQLGVWGTTLHASGNTEMLDYARKARNELASDDIEIKLLAVTVLTSMNDANLQNVGVKSTVRQQVQNLASVAAETWMDGAVCSAQEVQIIKEIDPTMLAVCPGIRLEDGNRHDQKRVMTPEQAINAGADYLVIGRPITQADNPLFALDILTERCDGPA